jgi:N-carbamoyl-L-amino-acid hydrolase
VSGAAGLRVDGARLMRRLFALAEVGAIDGGGVSRLALTDADRAGRDLVVGWMRALGLAVTIDRVGNVLGTRAGAADLPPVIIGSHIDTVRTGGKYDGNYGVLAGLEVIERLAEAGVATRHPIAVGFFTNEEGARFQPDMLGSAVTRARWRWTRRWRRWRSTARCWATSWRGSATPATRRWARCARRRTSSCTSSRGRCSSARA